MPSPRPLLIRILRQGPEQRKCKQKGYLEPRPGLEVLLWSVPSSSFHVHKRSWPLGWGQGWGEVVVLPIPNHLAFRLSESASTIMPTLSPNLSLPTNIAKLLSLTFRFFHCFPVTWAMSKSSLVLFSSSKLLGGPLHTHFWKADLYTTHS